MANFFSKQLYIQGLKKIKISGIAFSLIIILLNAFMPIIGIIDGSSYSSQFRGVEIVGHNQIVPFCFLVIFLVPIIAHDMFSFLNERNQSDFYHSIPQKRTCVYLSFTAAILTWAFGTILLSTVVNSLLWTMASTYTFTFGTVILGMLPFLVLSVQMAGVMILAMTVTGTRISNFLVAILFFLFFRAMSAFAVNALGELTPILYIDGSAFRYFNLDFFLPYALLEGCFDGDADVYTNVVLQIYTLLVGIAFLVLGAVAYCKRRSESATKSAPSKLLQHIYRFAITLPFVFMIGFFVIMDGFESYQIILVILAVLVYVLYELITTKKLKNVVKSLPLMIVPVVITVLIVSGLFVTRNTINNDVFEADEIVGFAFVERYRNTYENYNTQQVIVKNDEAAEIIADSLKKTVSNEYDYMSLKTVRQIVKIKLESGRVVTKYLRILSNEYTKLEEMLVYSPEYSEKFLELPAPSKVISVMSYGRYGATSESNDELYECFYNEFNKLSYEDKIAVKFPKDEYNSVVQIGVNGYYKSQMFTSSYHIVFDYMPLTTLKYLEIMGASYAGDYRNNIEYYAKQLDFYKTQGELENIEYAYGEISFKGITGKTGEKEIELIHKRYGSEMVVAAEKIFDIILSDPDAFIYEDPEKVYKFSYYLDLGLNTPVDVLSYETDSYTVKSSYSTDIPIVIEKSELSQYFYINDEIYVTVSDENFEAIKQIIYNLDAETTPNTETVE